MIIKGPTITVYLSAMNRVLVNRARTVAWASVRGKGAQEASGDNTLVKKCVTLRLAARKSLQFVLGPRGSTVFPETAKPSPYSRFLPVPMNGWVSRGLCSRALLMFTYFLDRLRSAICNNVSHNGVEEQLWGYSLHSRFAQQWQLPGEKKMRIESVV